MAVAALALGRSGAVGVAAAGGIALLVQVAAFALLARTPLGTNGFLLAWVGGTLVRLVVVGLAAWALLAAPRLPPLPTLLGLAGFFFVMLLLEPAFLGLGRTRQTRDRAQG